MNRDFSGSWDASRISAGCRNTHRRVTTETVYVLTPVPTVQAGPQQLLAATLALRVK